MVFGDIGTSPLYALHTAFSMDHNPVGLSALDVYGTISMVLWTITLIVTVKYVTLVTRADNDGEGGILALLCCGGGPPAGVGWRCSPCWGWWGPLCSTGTR